MSDAERDPAADTEMFRAFVERGTQDGRSRRPLILGVCGVVLAGAVVVIALLLR